MYVMASEPLKDISSSEFEAFFTDRCTAADLADAYALSSNKFWWVEDNEYDYAVGTPEHYAACAVTDEWLRLMDHYKELILAALKEEGIPIPPTAQINVLMQFMQKYGYTDCRGWWVKEQK